jgi:hypothetical protein
MKDKKDGPKYTNKSTVLLPEGRKYTETLDLDGSRIRQVFNPIEPGTAHLRIKTTSLLERGMKDPSEDGPKI